MLTIGELAGLAGTTVRAIRHYHAEGLLPEPVRDSLGHRRYGMPDLVRLVRIRQLRKIGLPVDRIPGALSGELGPLLEAFDIELAEQERALAAQREKVAELRKSTVDSGLPDGVERLYKHFSANGVRADLVELDRQSWQLLGALAPDALAMFNGTCLRALDDPAALNDWLRLALLFQDPSGIDDAELGELAARMAALFPKHPALDGRGKDVPPTVQRLLANFLGPFNSTQRKLANEVAARVTGIDLP